MERPIFATPQVQAFDAAPMAAPSSPGGPLDAITAVKLVAWVVLAELAFGLFGSGLGRTIGTVAGLSTACVVATAAALGFLLAKLGALAVLFDRISALAPKALRDRSHTGCAWFGAADERVVIAFLSGGLLACARVLLLQPDPASASAPGLGWHPLPAILTAFAIITMAPVLEELFFRGALFAAARSKMGTAPAATLVTVLFTLVHYDQILAHPPTLVGTLALGALTMASRIRHASIAPAIALHCGHNFIACMAMVLG